MDKYSEMIEEYQGKIIPRIIDPTLYFIILQKYRSRQKCVSDKILQTLMFYTESNKIPL